MGQIRVRCPSRRVVVVWIAWTTITVGAASLWILAACGGGPLAAAATTKRDEQQQPRRRRHYLVDDVNRNDDHRKLQEISIPTVPKGVDPTVALLLALVENVGDGGNFETPIFVRVNSYQSAIYWNCVAVYSTNFKDALTKGDPVFRVPIEFLHTTANRATCAFSGLASYVFLTNRVTPQLEPIFKALGIKIDFEELQNSDVFHECGINATASCLKAVASQSRYDPVQVGAAVAQSVYDYSLMDGWNELGTEGGCTANCRPYMDTTGYEPQTDDIMRWQPLLEDNGLGFFYYQEHVTPHIGEKAIFRNLPEADRVRRTLTQPPPYSSDLDIEADAVIEIMRDLDDEKKLQVEVFDNKSTVLQGVLNSWMRYLAGIDFEDEVLGTSLYSVSWERVIHFIVGYTAGEYDSVVIAWKEKRKWDRVRPTTIIKARGEDEIIETWAPGGVQQIRAVDFEAYIRVMPHSEYVSGSSCIFQMVEEYVIDYNNALRFVDPFFEIAFPPFGPGESIVEPGLVPAQELQLVYEDVVEMVAVGSQSRIDGGMHFGASVPAGRQLCAGIGNVGAAAAIRLYD